MHDELRSAYAALGLQPGAPLPKVKRQFKTLVRRWHPDRFTNDPQGVAEANHRLRVINNAYSTIVAAEVRPVVTWQSDPGRTTTSAAPADTSRPANRTADATGSAPPPPITERLTRDQIDAIIAALTAHRRRRALRDQMRDDPFNRAGSVVVVGLYLIGRVWMAWRYPWPRLALAGVRPTMPATGPVLAAIVETALWTLPLLYVIWYGNTFSKITAWIFLLLFALVLPMLLTAVR